MLRRIYIQSTIIINAKTNEIENKENSAVHIICVYLRYSSIILMISNKNEVIL